MSQKKADPRDPRRWTAQTAAEEFGWPLETLRRKLRERGHRLQRHARYTTREITDALFGNLEVEKIRLTKADADVREMERAEKQGLLVPMELAEKRLAETLAPFRSNLLAMPDSVAPQCVDPESARRAIKAEVIRLLEQVSNRSQ
jgi:phage terminase Nu1 subunit (DNA packaging protein)